MIIRGPVHNVAVACFLEEVHGDLTIGQPRTHPADGALAFVPGDRLRDGPNKGRLGLLRQVPLFLGVRDPVPQNLIPALPEFDRNIGAVLVDSDIHLGLYWNVEGIKQLKEPPDPDAIAIVAPGENAVTLGLIGRGNGRSFPGPIAELFDIEGHVDR